MQKIKIFIHLPAYKTSCLYADFDFYMQFGLRAERKYLIVLIHSY